MAPKRRHAVHSGTSKAAHGRLATAARIAETVGSNAQNVYQRVRELIKNRPKKPSKNQPKRPVHSGSAAKGTLIESTAFPDKIVKHYETHKARKFNKLTKLLGSKSIYHQLVGVASISPVNAQQVGYVYSVMYDKTALQLYMTNMLRAYNTIGAAEIGLNPAQNFYKGYEFNFERSLINYKIANNAPTLMDIEVYLIVLKSDVISTGTAFSPATTWTQDLANEEGSLAGVAIRDASDIGARPMGDNFKKLYRIEKHYSVVLGAGCVHHGVWDRKLNKKLTFAYINDNLQYKGLTAWIMTVQCGSIANDTLGTAAIGTVGIGTSKYSSITNVSTSLQILQTWAPRQQQFTSLGTLAVNQYEINVDTGAVVDMSVAANTA